SSAAIFGSPVYLPIDENHPKEPENYYGFTKLEIERILEWYDRLKGLKFAAIRYFNAAGYDVRGRIRGLERNPANLLPVIMEVAAGSPADKAGLKGGDKLVYVRGQPILMGGDVLLAVDDSPVRNFDEYRNIILQKSPGEQVRLRILRGSLEQQLSATLEPDPRI
ncbi:MAG: PDZ domain-containing protein, partial [Desulfomonilaceae bacterium]